MTQPVTLHFRYTREEYVAAVRQFFDPFRLKLYGVLGALLLLLGAFAGAVSDDPFYPWFLSIFGVVSLALFYRSYFLAPRRWYDHISARGDYTLQCSDAGVGFRAKDMESSLRWSLYREARENERFYFLVYGKHAFTVIPKRVFTSADQERSFRELLRQHVAPALESPADERASRVKTEYAPKSLQPPDWR